MPRLVLVACVLFVAYGWQDRLTWEPGWWRVMKLTSR
jgi:hypothetical protein